MKIKYKVIKTIHNVVPGDYVWTDNINYYSRRRAIRITEIKGDNLYIDTEMTA